MTRMHRIYLVTAGVAAAVSFSAIGLLAEDCEGEPDENPAACGGFYDWNYWDGSSTSPYHASPGTVHPDWPGGWDNVVCLSPRTEPHSEFRDFHTLQFENGSHRNNCES